MMSRRVKISLKLNTTSSLFVLGLLRKSTTQSSQYVIYAKLILVEIGSLIQQNDVRANLFFEVIALKKLIRKALRTGCCKNCRVVWVILIVVHSRFIDIRKFFWGYCSKLSLERSTFTFVSFLVYFLFFFAYSSFV